ncbi:putative ribonuclease H-like domain-containing protein [Tanacetum coccineum]
MTKNMSYLSDFKEFDEGDVAFGGGAKGRRIIGKGTLKTANESQVLLKVPRKKNMYSVDMKNIVPKESLTCLVAKATLDESMLWHRRLGHVNFKTINKLVKDNLVKGLPIKHFENDQTYVACLKGKQHKASSSKDETSGILKSFITQIENLVDKKVKIIRCDNGAEFKNRVISEFCEKKGIKREFSVARTPQQNGVVERRNRTLIEAARTMILVVKPHNKTPYELFRGRTPSLSFLKPFGCHVTILNTLDHLGKFDRKFDDGFFVRYSLNSKAFRVYNIRTRKVEENLHVRFLEDKPIIAGDGPKWLFDIDVLTKSMNYVPVVAGTNSNDFVGTKESIGAGHSSEETGSSQDYILMPLWKDGSPFDSSSKDASNDEPQPSNDAGKKDDEGGIDDQERTENSAQDVNTAGPSINTASTNFNTGSLNINTVSPTVPTAPLESTYADFFGDESELDLSNIATTYPVPTTPNTRIHKDHSLDHAFRAYNIRTRKVEENLHVRFLEDKPIIAGTNSNDFVGTKESNGADHSRKEPGSSQDYILMPLWKDGLLFDSFLKDASNNEPQPSNDVGDVQSGEEPKKVIQALKDPRWIEAMQEELLQFKLQQVWTLVDLPYSKRAIRKKWVYRNKKDERVARIEAIGQFLAYASFKDFVVYQMDVKSAFLYGKIKEEVYVCQPPGFEDPEFPDKVYKVEKALYGLHQAPRACDILLVQVYVDDIIFGSTKKELCTDFEKLMHKKFQMSSMGELTFFLGLQVTQKDDGIFISQDKYVDEILKKFGFSTVKTASTPMETSKPLLKDAEAEDVDVHLYRSMIGSLMYLTASRPDIMFVVCACARFQVTPKVSHLHAVKRIFRYLKGQPKLGLWYPKDSPFDLEAYTDSDYAGASLDRKSTTGAEDVADLVAVDSRDSNEKKLIQMIKIHTDHNVADLLIKAFDVRRFQYLIPSIGMLNP